MDLLLGEGWAVVRWGLIGGGWVGMSFFVFFFSFFFVRLRWILLAVNDVG